MVDPNGHTTIMDFGIVKESEDDTLTKTGIVFGTPDYMAPEHAQGQAPSPATDLYSLGIVAYEMLTGDQPFKGSSPFSLVLKHIKQPPPPLIERRDDIDQAFQDVIFTAIAKTPEERYPTAGAMTEALKKLVLDPPSMPSLTSEVTEDPSASSMESAVPHLPEDDVTPATGVRSIPKNRPSIVSGGQVSHSQGSGVSTPSGIETPSASVPLLPHPNTSDRPGHYSHLVTAVQRSASPWKKTLRYGLITVVVVGVVGGILAYFLKS
jgi:serine/threonine protein kinase